MKTKKIKAMLEALMLNFNKAQLDALEGLLDRMLPNSKKDPEVGWDRLNDHGYVVICGMYVGIEKDGYAHT